MRARRRRDVRGAAAVEFGLVAVVLFTVLFGIIQFGIYFWAWQQTGHAAREASRFAAVYPKCAQGISDRGTEALNGAPLNGTPRVQPTGTAPTQIGDDVTVTVTATAIDIGFFSSMFSPGISKSATSRVENVPSSPCPAVTP
jgi:Flp pilus assembly protein TadG